MKGKSSSTEVEGVTRLYGRKLLVERSRALIGKERRKQFNLQQTHEILGKENRDWCNKGTTQTIVSLGMLENLEGDKYLWQTVLSVPKNQLSCSLPSV